MRSRVVALVVLACVCTGGAGCKGRRSATIVPTAPKSTTTQAVIPAGPLALLVEPIQRSAKFPRGLTCEGGNTPPAFAYGNIPPGTAELVMLMEDHGAPGGNFTHWVVYGIPPQRGIVDRERQPGTTTFGLNDNGSVGYVGPCPPEGGGRHTYTFTLYAMGSKLDLPAKATPAQVRTAMGRSTTIATDAVEGFYEFGLDTDDGRGAPGKEKPGT